MKMPSKRIFPGAEVFVLGCRDTLLDGYIVERAGDCWVVAIQGNTFRVSDTEIFPKHDEAKNA